MGEIEAEVEGEWVEKRSAPHVETPGDRRGSATDKG
jgi:hypothetical protein